MTKPQTPIHLKTQTTPKHTLSKNEDILQPNQHTPVFTITTKTMRDNVCQTTHTTSAHRLTKKQLPESHATLVVGFLFVYQDRA